MKRSPDIERALALLSRLAGGDPLLRALAAMEEGRGVRLVGGVVRDALLDPDRPVGEIDLAVPRDAVGLAAQLAQATGAGLVVLSEKDDTARLMPKAGPGAQLDLTGFRGPDLASDLAGRDYTVNSLAVDLTELTQGRAELIDPLGGLDDLAAGRLIPTGSSVLIADPLRVWRGLRLAAQLDLDIPPATWQGMLAAAPGLSRVAGERQAQELRLLLAQPKTAELWRRAADYKLLGLLLPPVGRLGGLYQNRFHHLDGLAHTIETLVRLERLLADPPAWASRPLEAWVVPVLKLAALFHDAGKADLYQVRPDGGLSFPGHEKLGSEIWLDAAGRLKLSRAETKLGEMLIACHMRPLHLLLTPEVSVKAMRRLIRKAGGHLAALGLLVMADSYASQGPARDPDWETRLDELWTELTILAAEMNRLGETPILTGDQVMDHLGIPSGPLVGRLLAELAEARLSGLVSNRSQALSWLDRRFRELTG